jgi:Domain of unknown function (DUF1996)
MWRRLFAATLVAATLVAVALGAAPARNTDNETSPRSPAALGSFRVECTLVRQQRVDPIVAWGKVSHHLHDFFGNTSVVATSTYESLRGGRSTCSAAGDRAGYWLPTLMTPRGERVRPDRFVVYYRNRPVRYGRTAAFPRGLRLVAGGTFPTAYWTCEGEPDAAIESRKAKIPDCGGNVRIKAHVFFPSCWDGEHVDASDHRRHLVYGLDRRGRVSVTDPDRCPASHPVKVPQLDMRVVYPVSDGRDYRLSDGRAVPHADYFNAWEPRALQKLVAECLGRAGRSCGLVEDS